MAKKNDWKHDTEYIRYIESGESAAVFVVRDLVNSINTSDMWVDVISLSTYHKRGAGNSHAFNWIIVELFPRKMIPKYVGKDSAYNKYLTWLTAHEDIEEQRRAGFHGEKYLVLCDLFDKNKNKFITRTIIAKKYWEPIEAYRPMEVKDPIPPEWEYRIRAVRKVNSKQVKYVADHVEEIIERIRERGRPMVEFFV